MRRISALLLCALLIVFSLAPLFVIADGLYDETYDRVCDYAGVLDAGYLENLREHSADMSLARGIDLVYVTVNSYDYEGYALADYADWIYEEGLYGWGENRDCIICIYCPENEDLDLLLYGRPQTLITESYRQFALEKAPGYREEYGDWGVLYSLSHFCENRFEEYEVTPEGSKLETKLPEISLPEVNPIAPESADPAPLPDSGRSEATAAPDETGALQRPSWYPDDISSFKFFHDESAPRVIDNADILSAAEEAEILAKARSVIEDTGRDVVVYTDVTAYGLEHDMYAADFYDYNGYGFGDERDGLILFFCMDPDDRGYTTVATGSSTEKLFTYDYSEEMDDLLYEYAVDGKFKEGIISWLDLVRNLYTKGRPYAPDWLPDMGKTNEAFNRDLSAGYVLDEADLLSGEEEAELNDRAEQISRKYGSDVLIMTCANAYGMYTDEFTELYYKNNGVGFGPANDGILMVIFPDSGSCAFYARGKAGEKLTDINLKRLDNLCENESGSGAYGQTCRVFLNTADRMLKTGRVPRSLKSWIGTGALGTVVGGLFGGASLGRAKKMMNTPVQKTEADAYVTKCVPTDSDDIYLNSTVTRTRIERSSSGGGGSSSGGGSHSSSYHSSYRSSSGSSHTSSSRKF